MAAIDIARGSKRWSRNSSRRRGILGIESAIVMIAFVVVAAALAFVVLNAGFGTTQKSKTTISEGLASATGAVEVAGIVTGNNIISTTPERIEFYSIPIKLASGANAVNLQKELTAIRYFSNTIAYDNIYVGTARNNTIASYSDELSMLKDVDTGCQYQPGTPNSIYKIVNNTPTFTPPTKTCAIIWWSNSVINNDILDGGEVAVLTIVYKADDRPAQLDKITAELVLAGASVLTVERVVPTITTTVVNMG
ncbi:MAG: archaellin/type IV pilin N-terminal domain-containing protein [Candidatus Nitrosocaldus sp.]